MTFEYLHCRYVPTTRIQCTYKIKYRDGVPVIITYAYLFSPQHIQERTSPAGHEVPPVTSSYYMSFLNSLSPSCSLLQSLNSPSALQLPVRLHTHWPTPTPSTMPLSTECVIAIVGVLISFLPVVLLIWKFTRPTCKLTTTGMNALTLSSVLCLIVCRCRAWKL